MVQSEEPMEMAVSTSDADPSAEVRVGITLTPADVNIIAGAICSELACKWAETFIAPLPGREDIVRIRAILDLHERQLETLEWGEPETDVEIECPTARLNVVAHDLLDGRRGTEEDHRLAVCAVIQHLLTEVHQASGFDRIGTESS
jgi:hypothetical protein